jgi:hypothetical protein
MYAPLNEKTGRLNLAKELMAAINRPIKLIKTRIDLSFPMNKSVSSAMIPNTVKTSTGARLIRSMGGAAIGSNLFIP